MLSLVSEDGTTEAGSLIDEIVREGARRMLAAALEAEVEAVIAGLTLPYSNGPTEGVNTKTKRIARQMHGRAGFALLRHRILLG
ncbi:transposase [Streptomyces sp. B3I8]|nr:transposase [Streptomyces sp. B3I8]MDQ0784661.1 transposase [Streptomyces sp. B3I8]